MRLPANVRGIKPRPAFHPKVCKTGTLSGMPMSLEAVTFSMLRLQREAEVRARPRENRWERVAHAEGVEWPNTISSCGAGRR